MSGVGQKLETDKPNSFGIDNLICQNKELTEFLLESFNPNFCTKYFFNVMILVRADNRRCALRNIGKR